MRKNWDKILTRDFLFKEYVENKKSTIKIANQIGCHKRTVLRKLKKFNILSRSLIESANLRKHPKEYEQFLTKQLLIQEYKIFKHSPYEIARLFGVNQSAIYTYLKYHNIEIFPKGYLHKNKIPWNKDKIDCYSEESRMNMSKHRTGQHNSIDTEFKKGHLSDYYTYKYNNIFMRSSYEVIYAKWLDLAGIKWEYEPKTFRLDDTHYTPDFYLPEFDVWVEVKGYWYEDSLNRFLLFKEKYSDIFIDVIKFEDLEEFKLLNQDIDNYRLQKI